jgi:hypothetical protein
VRRNTAGLFAVLVTGALLAAGPVLAQSTTTTPASTSGSTTGSTTDYGNTQTVTTSTPTTSVPNDTQTGVSPSSTVSATPTASAPTSLAFTGANALWIILLGAGLAAVAGTLLFVDRRSRRNR